MAALKQSLFCPVFHYGRLQLPTELVLFFTVIYRLHRRIAEHAVEQLVERDVNLLFGAFIANRRTADPIVGFDGIYLQSICPVLSAAVIAHFSFAYDAFHENIDLMTAKVACFNLDRTVFSFDCHISFSFLQDAARKNPVVIIVVPSDNRPDLCR